MILCSLDDLVHGESRKLLNVPSLPIPPRQILKTRDTRVILPEFRTRLRAQQRPTFICKLLAPS